MKRIFTLLLALVMVLSLAAPALAAEDAFEVPEAEEAAAPEAPEAPIEEEAPVEEAPEAEAPDLPQTAAAEPEDTTEPAPQTGKLTLKGDLDMLWCVRVVNDVGETDYMGEFDTTEIPIQEDEVVALVMDYRYTAEFDKERPSMELRGVLNAGLPNGLHTGDVANVMTLGVTAEGGCDLTVTIVEDPEAPTLIPVTVTAPEGIYVEASKAVLSESLASLGSVTCDAGYVPLFTGAESMGSYETEGGHITTLFIPIDGAESISIDLKKATGELHITDPDDKAAAVIMGDGAGATADCDSGLVGGLYLGIAVEAGYTVKTDAEVYASGYALYEGKSVHGYAFLIPADGDIDIEIVKDDSIAMPKSGTGWAYDKTTGDYYYFVDGVQKFNYWANEPAASKWGYWYYVGIDGKLATGFQYVENENGTGWYMFQTDNDDGCIGRMLTGPQWTYSDAGIGFFNTAHGGLNGQCLYTTGWGAYNAATGMWADGQYHRALG